MCHKTRPNHTKTVQSCVAVLRRDTSKIAIFVSEEKLGKSTDRKVSLDNQ